MYKNRFCFRILPEAGMAHDGEGNNSSAYLEVKFDTDKPINDEEYKEIHSTLIGRLSNQLDIDENHLVEISVKEYDENHEETV